MATTEPHTAPSAPPPRRAPRRWLRRTLAGAGIVLGLALAAVLLLATSLDRPWLKPRLQAWVRAQSGLDVDWAAARLRTGGLHLDGLRVASPHGVRSIAPMLLAAEHIDAEWTTRSLSGRGPALTRLYARELELTLARAADGRTTLTALDADNPTPAAAAAPASPTSRLLADLLASPLPAARIELERATLQVIADAPGGAREDVRIDGLSLTADTMELGPAFRLRLRAGERERPLALSVRRLRGGGAAGDAHARLWLDLDAAPHEAEAQLEVAIIDQTILPRAQVQEAVALKAHAKLDPRAGTSALTIERARLADGAFTTMGSLALSDAGVVSVDRAAGELDLVRLQRWLPPEWLPATAQRGHATYEITKLTLDPWPRLAPDGVVALDGEVMDLSAPVAPLQLDVAQARFELRAQPSQAGGMHVRLQAPLASLRVVQPGQRIEAGRAEVSLDGRIETDRRFTGDVAASFQRFALGGKTPFAARDGKLTLHARELTVDTAAPLASRGELSAEGVFASVTVTTPQAALSADGASLTAQAQLSGHAPYRFEATLPIARLRVQPEKGRALLDSAAKLHVAARELFPDAERPLRTRAVGELGFDVGPLHASARANKQPDTLDLDLTADAASLAPLRALVPPDARLQPALEPLGLSLRAHARLQHLSSAQPLLDQHTEARLDRIALAGKARHVKLASLALTTDSHGTVRALKGSLELRAQDLAIDKTALGNPHVQAQLALDLDAPSVELHLVDEAGARLHAALGFDRAKKTLRYDLDAGLKLKPVAPFFGAQPALARFDISRTELTLSGKGVVHGLVEEVARDGTPRFSTVPLLTTAVEGTLAAGVSGLHWEREDRELDVPKADFKALLHVDGTRRTVSGTLDAGSLYLAAGDHELTIKGVHDQLEAAISGDLRDGAGRIDHRLTVRTVEQDFAEAYPVAGVALDMQARRDASGVVHLESLRVDNKAAATHLELHGGLDLGDARRGLTLKGELTQDLQRLWSQPSTFSGRGTLAVGLQLESGNLRLYRALGVLKLRQVDVHVPRQGITVTRADGEVPLEVSFLSDPAGVRLLKQGETNAYSEVRFADQHPLLSSHSYLSIGKLETPFMTAQPIAGNLRIADDVISMDQLELGVRGGRVTGAASLSLRGDDSTVTLHVRATDVLSSHGERFDGNAAVVVSARRRSVEGRAEILRIGRRHLLDLLDLHDPHRSDVGVNRIRKALELGYPDRVRMAFNKGFASVKVTFGGLARLVRIDELRGIPMGPIIDKLLAGMGPGGNKEEP